MTTTRHNGRGQRAESREQKKTKIQAKIWRQKDILKFLQSQRDWIIQPRVATKELPWVNANKIITTLKGLQHSVIPKTKQRPTMQTTGTTELWHDRMMPIPMILPLMILPSRPKSAHE